MVAAISIGFCRMRSRERALLLVAGLSARRAWRSVSAVHLGLAVDEVALGRAAFRIRLCSPVITPPLPCINSHIDHRRYIPLTVDRSIYVKTQEI